MTRQKRLVVKGRMPSLAMSITSLLIGSLGEKSVHINCDNCSGQNKNNFVIRYLMWRLMTKLHDNNDNVEFHFLLAGHTHFAPDWCFGLIKQKYRRTLASSIDDFAKLVEESSWGVCLPFDLKISHQITCIVHTLQNEKIIQNFNSSIKKHRYNKCSNVSNLLSVSAVQTAT